MTAPGLDALPDDPATSLRADPLAAQFAAAGVLTPADVQTAAALVRVGAGRDTTADDPVRLLAALCVRALRHGSIALPWAGLAIREATTDDGVAVSGLPWPDPETWRDTVLRHPAVGGGGTGSPLVWHDEQVYLRKYYEQESLILADVVRRSRAALTPAVGGPVTATGPGETLDEGQLVAVAAAIRQPLTILAGGPGTGKTTTVARILHELRHREGADLTVALAAPTGKAAARLADAVAAPATTLHRLLGSNPMLDRPFRHDRFSPLPHDVVIVDECSMIDVTLMARLLDAVRPDARLVLVGDPGQLAAVDAGAALGDLVAVAGAAPAERVAQIAASADLPTERVTPLLRGAGVVTLARGHRFTGSLADLAAAVAAGDGDAVVDLLTGSEELEFVPTAGPPGAAELSGLRTEVTATAARVRAAALAGDAEAALDALDAHRLLCAHRSGPYGVSHWNAVVRGWTGATATAAAEWEIGQGVIVTANDYTLGVFNGDSGVVVARPGSTPAVAFPRPGGARLVPPGRLDAVTSLDAMTVHRGQGSQFAAVTVILPEPDSPLLTRELLYTAVTRARTRVRVIGSEQAVRAAVGRRVVRASGLTERLTAALAEPQ